MAAPTLHVVCHNPECYWHGHVRLVRLQYLRQGIYAKSELLCECGWEPKQTTPPAPELISEAVQQEFEWAVMEPPC